MLFTTQQHWPWCLIHVDGHLQPRAQQHNPHWQQTSLSTNDSQHVSGGTPALKQQRLTQQQSSPLQDAPQHLRDCVDGVEAPNLSSDAASGLREVRVKRRVAAQAPVDEDEA